jgi:hypothetical protein
MIRLGNMARLGITLAAQHTRSSTARARRPAAASDATRPVIVFPAQTDELMKLMFGGGIPIRRLPMAQPYFHVLI